MVLKTRTTNVYYYALIKQLRKASRDNKVKIWRYVAELLDRPRRKRVIVNLSKIDRLTKEGDIVIVPGKVLAGGDLTHSVTIAAYAFSEKAKEKITKAKGRAINILELIKENPKGSNVKIII